VKRQREKGFTLIEVLVALAVIAIGLSALMSAISGTASASGYLRLKAQAQWIALNRLIEVRLNMQKFATSTDTGELDYAGQHWHYDTRYFDTSIPTMQRVVVRVWAGTAATKSNPLGEYTGFVGTALASAGTSNAVDWTAGSVATPFPGAAPGNGSGASPTPALPIPGLSRGIGGGQQQGGLGLDGGSGDGLGGDSFGDGLGTNGNGNGSSSGGDSSSSGGLQNDSSGGSP
jgi:general secretion pathway protein I